MSSEQARRSSSYSPFRTDVIDCERKSHSFGPGEGDSDSNSGDGSATGTAASDAVATLLDRLDLRAVTFFSGRLQGFAKEPVGPLGQLHLLRMGSMVVRRPGHPPITISEPSLVLFARSAVHGLDARAGDGADLVCAHVDLDVGGIGSLLLGQPDPLVVPVAGSPDLRPVLDLLFGEAEQKRLGYRSNIDRLVEVLLVTLLRHVIDRDGPSPGLVAALADPRLAGTLRAVHAQPEQAWTLERLAGLAGMSRASFAVAFKGTLGVTPGAYLTDLRLSLVKRGLRAGQSLKTMAVQTGYASPTALARVFRQRVGVGPREWIDLGRSAGS